MSKYAFIQYPFYATFNFHTMALTEQNKLKLIEKFLIFQREVKKMATEDQSLSANRDSPKTLKDLNEKIIVEFNKMDNYWEG